MTLFLGRRTIRAALEHGAAVLVFGLAACSGESGTPEGGIAVPPAADAALIENGRAIAGAQCAPCHAIGTQGESPRADAPPLRTVLAGYDPDALADSFREGIHVGHPDMPDFGLGPKGTDSVLAYLLSIREKASEG